MLLSVVKRYWSSSSSSADLAWGFAFCGASREVGPSLGTVAHSAGGDGIEGAVGQAGSEIVDDGLQLGTVGLEHVAGLAQGQRESL